MSKAILQQKSITMPDTPFRSHNRSIGLKGGVANYENFVEQCRAAGKIGGPKAMVAAQLTYGRGTGLAEGEKGNANHYVEAPVRWI